MANRSTIFQCPGGDITGDDIEKVLGALKTNNKAAEYAVEIIHQEHRTHQQSFMRLFVYPLLGMWAKDKEHGRFDDRNRATVECASRAVSGENADMGFPYI